MTLQSAARLALVPHYVVPIGSDEIHIRTSTRLVRLRGAVVREVMPRVLLRLDGSLTEEQVVREVGAEIDSRKVRGMIKALRERELLREVPDRVPVALERYLDAFSGGGAAAVDHLARARVQIVDEDTGVGALLARLLSRSGVGEVSSAPAAEEGGAATLLVAVVNGPAAFSAQLAQVNEDAVERGVVLLPCAMLGAGVVQLGPMVVPGVTACLACLRAQLERALAPLRHAPGYGGGGPDDLRPDPLQRRMAAAYAAAETVRASLPDSHATTYGTVHTFVAATLGTETYSVRRDPRCATCGTGRNAPPMRIWS